MNGQVDSGQKALVLCEFLDDIGGEEGNLVHKISVGPEEIPKLRWHRESDMLPFGIG